MRRLAVGSVVALVAFAGPGLPARAQELVGRAVLPADTFAPGPPSGARVPAVNGVSSPFASQPVQGVSALVDRGDGVLLALADNGYGSQENSADFQLRVYVLRPDLKTKAGGSGRLQVTDFVTLHDPDRLIRFPIVNMYTARRVLTGSDFDVESFQVARDGSFWFGDEFGPYLLHTDASGRLLEAPIALTDSEGRPLLAPQNPGLEEGALMRSLLALSARGKARGAYEPVTLAPSHVLFKDGDPRTAYGHRSAPPPASGLAKASSEIVDLDKLHQAGLRAVPYTVNESARMSQLLAMGIDGIISDDPELLLAAVKAYDPDGDGQPDLIDAEGLIRADRFDAQGHRGARNLRPENTLPAFEAALDNLMTTLETDAGITKDGVALLCHEEYLLASKFRRADGFNYGERDTVLIKDLRADELQELFIGDKLLPGRPKQKNDRKLSPVSVAFAKGNGLKDPYTPPTLAQLFDFVAYYEVHYRFGMGSRHPQASQRWKNARRVRFNVETKINPRRDRDGFGRPYDASSADPRTFARVFGSLIRARGLTARVEVQSFDVRTLLHMQDLFPEIRLVWLIGDYPVGSQGGDGTNLQPEGDQPSPWIPGMPWPYRKTAADGLAKVPTSGGLEGMAASPDKRKLYPMLEKPLVGSQARVLLIREFDVEQGAFTDNSWTYPLSEKATAIGDFQLYTATRGLVIERDDSQGDLSGFKQIFAVDLSVQGKAPLQKTAVVDLLRLKDSGGVSQPAEGDVGLGKEFAFPFWTIESLVVKGARRLLVANDNNYPFSVGRHVGSKRPDDTELIEIELAEELPK